MTCRNGKANSSIPCPSGSPNTAAPSPTRKRAPPARPCRPCRGASSRKSRGRPTANYRRGRGRKHRLNSLNRLNGLNGLKWRVLTRVRLVPRTLTPPSVGAAGWRAGGAPGLRPDENKKYRFDEDRRSARTVFRELASGGGVIALPQRPRRAGRACAPSRNGRVSPSTLAPLTHPEAVMGVFESRPIARDAVARCLRPLQPRSIRSRRSQGRRPYEPSVRRDGRSVARS